MGNARGQPGIATAGCSGDATRVEILCNGGATRVEILAVQRSAVRDRQYRNGRVDRRFFSPAHSEGCLRRLLALSPPLPHGGAQRPEGASAASAGAVSHGSCLASHCPCVVIESKAGGHRRVASSRCRRIQPQERVWPGSASTSARCSGHMPPRAWIPSPVPHKTCELHKHFLSRTDTQNLRIRERCSSSAPAPPQAHDQLLAAASDDKDDATDIDYTINDTATAHFLFLIPPLKQGINPSDTAGHKWKSLKMLRKKNRGTRYPSTTGRTYSTTPPTPRADDNALPANERASRPTTPDHDHDYISDHRNDDFEGVTRNHSSFCGPPPL